ncbi:RNA polymerase II-associated protein 3 [Ceratina calcarata]|uniref:RNA polymerase II-associated protein 3 n=1 Tax=Ceratina calcarata TaxID=156304 RepID=A0AAJ7WBX5_9HYME|nr:RNA polymerase II-associated protein 3 [Ceratina calcarata]
MVENDTEIVRVVKSEKKTLLERYDIPVEHLSYEYISECKNAKKLERIVTVLRSGEEGYYPDLTKHAEQHLAVIKPASRILRKSEPVVRRNMLEPSECKEIDKDIKEWMSEMQIREKDLEEGKTNIIDPVLQPDIRQFKEDPRKNNSTANLKCSTNSKRIASCDYSAWDKYDVDTELNKIDIRDEQQMIQTKRLQQKQKEFSEKKKLTKNTMINKSSLTGTEIDVMAEQEREKGNEAFRAGDYEEALEHYNTSIGMNSNITAYNNRAMTYIKLRQYENALKDCNIVISMEYMNIKAILRRAVALEHLGKSSQALVDYEAVLKLEPNNAAAIAGVKKLRKPCFSKKIRMPIEEQISDTEEKSKSNGTEEKQKFIPQSSSMLSLSNSICYCDKAPGPSQYLRPRPHIKADYCLENEQARTNKNSATNKPETGHRKYTPELTRSPITSLNNLSYNVSKSFQDKGSSSTAKQKSIFSYTKPCKQTNSVIIEELPTETSDNDFFNTIDKSNDEILNRNNVNAKVASKNEISEDEQIGMSSIKSSNTNHEQSHSSNEKKCKKSSLTNIETADKNKETVEKTYIPKDIHNIETGYEFMRTWRSLKNDNDLRACAQLLRSLNIDKLNAVLDNELDGNMISTILHCLERHFCTSEDTELLNRFLRSLSQVKRFELMRMFMDDKDIRVVKNLLTFLEEHGSPGVPSLRQIYL